MLMHGPLFLPAACGDMPMHDPRTLNPTKNDAGPYSRDPGTCSRSEPSGISDPEIPNKHEDPTKHGFWYPHFIAPGNQSVGSLGL